MTVQVLERHLVLFHYFLDLLGVEDFRTLKDRIKDVPEGVDEIGRSHFLAVILESENLKLSESELLRADANIQEYQRMLRHHRSDPSFNFKYFQYLALLFTELYLERVLGREEQLQHFLDDLNAFLNAWNENRGTKLSPFTREDLHKIAYWMATGSGKTLLMHVNYWQVMRRGGDAWDNIILLTPNEGLSRQHHDELLASGISCQLYEGDIDLLVSRPKDILIIDIYKLTEEKKGRGITIDVNYFEGRNLVFIDEGHKGQMSEERKWKALRETLGKNGFIFEYSATFGQIVGKNADLLEEYAKSIIFDYSYRYFYLDGYGKDFFVFNLREQPSLTSDEFRYLVLTSCMLTFLEQLLMFEQHPDEMREHRVEKPLWVFVGSKVTGKKLNSDVMHVLRFFKDILSTPTLLAQLVSKILSGEGGLIDVHGNDIFAGKLEALKSLLQDLDREEMMRFMLQKIFHGTGPLEIHELKRADGELALKTSDAACYFGVVNVGNVRSLKTLISAEGIPLKEDHLSASLFADLNQAHSPIHVLIGAKKFVEGWNSWRVSTMGLLNVGKGEGPQIIQLFGRGVRLKGKDFTLKRENNAPSWLQVLQTLWIFGLNADYINTFLEQLATEEVTFHKIVIPLRLNHHDSWKNSLHVVTRFPLPRKNNIDPFLLEHDPALARTLYLDFRPAIMASRGFTFEDISFSPRDTLTEIPNDIIAILDWQQLYLDLLEFKREKNFHELIIINMDVLQAIISGKQYQVKIPASLREWQSFNDLEQWQAIACAILKVYVTKFYQDRISRIREWHVDVKPLTKNFSGVFPRSGSIKIRIPLDNKQLASHVSSLIDNPQKWDGMSTALMHADHHIYSPLITTPQDHHQLMLSFPRRLTASETHFIHDFEQFLQARRTHILHDHDVFLARVLPHSRFQKSLDDAFRPNFIVWLLNRENATKMEEHVIYVDLNGLAPWSNFRDDKIAFCTKGIKELERQAQIIASSQKTKNNAVRIATLKLHAYILSEIPFKKMKKFFDDGDAILKQFHAHHVLFFEERTPHYLERLLVNSLNDQEQSKESCA